MVQVLPIRSIISERIKSENEATKKHCLKRLLICLSIAVVLLYVNQSFNIGRYLHAYKQDLRSFTTLEHALNNSNTTTSNDKNHQSLDGRSGDDKGEDKGEKEDEDEDDTDGEEKEKKETVDKGEEPRTEYELVHNLAFENTFDYYKCDEIERESTSSIFTQLNKLDFQAKISTPLKVLIMGDSVGIQYSQALQEATDAHHSDRKVLRYSWGEHEGIHIASPVRGGGAIAGWRITGMLREEQIDNHKQMPNSGGGGWMKGDVKIIKRALATMSKQQNSSDISLSSESLQPSLCEVPEATAKRVTVVEPAADGQDDKNECLEEDFDIVIHQFPFGWLEKPTTESITYEKIHEAVQLSHKYFGAKTVILQTIPVQNNVIDMITELEAVNNAIFNYSNSYEYVDNKISVQNVLVMDVAKFSYELFAHNAAALGMITNRTDTIDQSLKNNSIAHLLNPLLENRTKCCNDKFPQIIGFTCAEKSFNTDDCVKTRYSRDGMHWCMDEVGGRINGGFACLLKCIEQESNVSEQLRECEKQCNDQFMSLRSMGSTVSNTTMKVH